MVTREQVKAARKVLKKVVKRGKGCPARGWILSWEERRALETLLAWRPAPNRFQAWAWGTLVGAVLGMLVTAAFVAAVTGGPSV